MSLYNCHTHIFTLSCVPNNALGIPVGNWISGDRVGRTIGKVVSWLTPNSPKKAIGRYLTFAEIGLSATQKKVFDNLAEVYTSWGSAKFVVLPMDMDQMGAGKANKSYQDQLREIIDIRTQNAGYADRLLPFLFLDPNRFASGDDILNFARPYFERYGFVGIKLYPAIGYYPFDEKLDVVYQYAVDRNLPVLTHVTQGPIYYRGDLSNKRNPRFTHKDMNLDEKKNSEFQKNFTDPENYRFVLQKFPNLKICLAHYGGADSILQKKGSNLTWYPKIKDLIGTFANAYTDISYTLYETSDDNKLFKTLLQDLNDPAIGNKILFGTDYYVVSPAKNEDKLRDEFRAFLNKNNRPDLFDRVTQSTPNAYLKSEFYEPK